MKRILIGFAMLLQVVCSWASTSEKIIATVTGTNLTGITNGAWIAVNGNQRTFTNGPIAVQALWIHATNTLNGNMTNAQRHYQQHAEVVSGYGAIVSRTNTAASFRLYGPEGGALAVTFSAGWASVTYVTNTITNAAPYITPYIEQPLEFRTNQVSTTVENMNTYPSNALLPGTVVMRNFQDLTTAQTSSNKTTVFNTNQHGYFTNGQIRSLKLVGPVQADYSITNQGRLEFAKDNTNAPYAFLTPDTNGAISAYYGSAGAYAAYNPVDDLGGPLDPWILPWASLKLVLPIRDTSYYEAINVWNTINEWNSGSNTFSANLRVLAGLSATGQVVQVETNRGRHMWAGRMELPGTNATPSGLTNAVLLSPLVIASNLTAFAGSQSNMLVRESTLSNITHVGRHIFSGSLEYVPNYISSIANGHNRIDIGTNLVNVILGGTATAAYQIGGIVGNLDAFDQFAYLIFQGSYPVTIRDNSGDESTQEYRIKTMNGGDTSSSGADAWAVVYYDRGEERWNFAWLNRGLGTADGGGANARFWSAASNLVSLSVTSAPALGVTNVIQVWHSGGARIAAVDTNGLWLGGLDTTFTNVTTDNTQTTLGALTLPNNWVGRLDVRIVGYATGYTNAAAYGRSGGFSVTNSTARLVGSVITALGDSEDIAGWDTTLDVSGQTARVRVTGATGTTVKWSAVVRVVPQLW